MKRRIIKYTQDLFGQVLGYIAKRYIERFQPTVIVIAGSIGKTATTQAIATVLKEHYTLRATHANYNTATGVPLSILGETFPITRLGWVALIPRMWLRSQKRQAFDLLVLEIGADHPGELQQFAYLQPTLGVVTAVTPEHMEFFKTLDAVAAEELSIGGFCKQLVVNKDMIRPSYLKKYAPKGTVLMGEGADYAIQRASGNTMALTCGDITLHGVKTHLVGRHSLYSLLAAASVAQLLGMDEKAIRRGLQNVTPVPGRMQLLVGKKHSKLIDDTYNSSPDAAIAALNTLYALPGKQHIALLGSMNELGKMTPLAHRNVGSHCDPKKLDLVVTLGDAANRYTAKAARKRGCEVVETMSPYVAAEVILAHLKTHATVLIKGSQNSVFAEETVKLLLKNPRDSAHLVRQTPYWLAVKRIAFQKDAD